MPHPKQKVDSQIRIDVVRWLCTRRTALSISKPSTMEVDWASSGLGGPYHGSPIKSQNFQDDNSKHNTA
jgi:hypothetical protein